MPSKATTGNTYTHEELLALYNEALAQLTVSGQSYSFGGRTFTSADLGEIRDTIDWLESKVSSAQEGLVSNLARLERS